MTVPVVKQYLKITAFIAAAFVLQTTVVSYVAISGIIPNLLLVSAICYATIKAEERPAAIMGLVCGALLDITGGRIFGVNTLLCMYFCLGCAYFAKRFFSGRMKVNLMFTLVVSLFYEVLCYLLYLGMWGQGRFTAALLSVIMPSVVYNGAISILIYTLLHKMLPKNKTE